MRPIIKFILSILSIMIFIFIIAMIPNVMQSHNGNIQFMPQNGLLSFESYVKGIGNGDTFHYLQGSDRHPNFFRDFGGYFFSSYLYLLISGILSVILGLVIGVGLSQSKLSWLKDLIGFLGVVPDFILVLSLQMAVGYIYELTGVHVAEISTTPTGSPPILLPLIALSIVPTIYLVRTLSERTFNILTEEYILLAKSKGIHKFGIYRDHVVRNIVPFLKADLHKTVSIMLSNLFIVEYLFNTRGLTTLMFTHSGYQYNLTVNTLFTFVILYAVLYWSIRLVLFELGERFLYD